MINFSSLTTPRIFASSFGNFLVILFSSTHRWHRGGERAVRERGPERRHCAAAAPPAAPGARSARAPGAAGRVSAHYFLRMQHGGLDKQSQDQLLTKLEL